MALDRMRDWFWHGNLSGDDKAWDYVKKHYAEHQEESASRIADFNILRLSRVPWIDVRSHGAKGDGSTDDTNSIQAAIDAAEAADGVGVVLVPAGHYKFTTLTFQKETAFVGSGTSSSGSYGTYLESTAASGSAISLTGAASADRKRLRFENFTIVGNANLDIGIDLSSSATIVAGYISLRDVEVRAMTKATGIGIYLSDVASIHMERVVARNGGMSYGLTMHSQYWNGGPLTAICCDFGQQDDSVAGLHYIFTTGNHYSKTAFYGCYFGGGDASGGNAMYLEENTPTNMVFDSCAFECANTVADGACILIECNTNGLTIRNSDIAALGEADRGIDFASGTHNGLILDGLYFDDIDAGGACIVDGAATFVDTRMINLSRSNAETGWSGSFASTLRNGFGSSEWTFGDTTNRLEIQSDGEIQLYGTARVIRDLWIAADGVRGPTTKPATWKEWGISGVWEFSDGTDDTVVGAVKFPNDMDMSVAPSVKVGWSTATTVTTETATWQLEYLYRQIGEDTTAAAQDTITVDSNAVATAHGLIVATFPAMDTPNASDVCVHMRIKRLGAGGNDDLTDTAELHGVCLEYTSNRLGTPL